MCLCVPLDFFDCVDFRNIFGIFSKRFVALVLLVCCCVRCLVLCLVLCCVVLFDVVGVCVCGCVWCCGCVV